MTKNFKLFVSLCLIAILSSCGTKEIIDPDETKYSNVVEKEKGEENFKPADFVINMKGKHLKVVNFADTHLKSARDIAPDSTIGQIIAHAMETEKPGIVTFTGDNAWAESVPYAYQSICDVMDQYEVPYFMVFGNHDREHDKDETLAAVVNNSKFGHILKGIEESSSYGNYTIDIRNKKDATVQRLIMIDSRDYYPTDESHYDNVRDEQFDWYINQVKDLTCTSSLFMHIPLPEFALAWDAYQSAVEANDQEALDRMQPIGKCRKRESVCSSSINFGFFDLIKEYGNTKNIIVGHDHSNDYSLVYQGVRMTFAVKTGAKASFYNETMCGYTTLDVLADGTTLLDQVYYYVAGRN